MRLTDYRNTTKQEVESKKHNIWVGISLGNKYFNQENLTDYIKSSLKLSKQDILVIIADTPQAINYEVFEGLSTKKALVKAQKNGDKISEIINNIISKLLKTDQNQIKIIRWNNILKTQWYQRRLKIFRKAFIENIDFKNKLIEIVKLNMKDRIEGLNDSQIEKLSNYVLKELPLFMGAIKLDGVIYDLHIYPGLSLMDDFILELQEKNIFPEIMENINIEHKLSIAEAYAE